MQVRNICDCSHIVLDLFFPFPENRMQNKRKSEKAQKLNTANVNQEGFYCESDGNATFTMEGGALYILGGFVPHCASSRPNLLRRSGGFE